jgi:hypothetical protein
MNKQKKIHPRHVLPLIREGKEREVECAAIPLPRESPMFTDGGGG